MTRLSIFFCPGCRGWRGRDGREGCLSGSLGPSVWASTNRIVLLFSAGGSPWVVNNFSSRTLNAARQKSGLVWRVCLPGVGLDRLSWIAVGCTRPEEEQHSRRRRRKRMRRRKRSRFMMTHHESHPHWVLWLVHHPATRVRDLSLLPAVSVYLHSCLLDHEYCRSICVFTRAGVKCLTSRNKSISVIKVSKCIKIRPNSMQASRSQTPKMCSWLRSCAAP